MDKNKVYFFDTTLRDGEQTPGVNFNTQEKVQIALQIEKWGADFIEAGFPRTSPGDLEAVKAIGQACHQSTIVGLARCNEKDIDAVYEALGNIDNGGIHIFIATSPIHREFKLNMSKEEVLESIRHHVAYAKKYFDSVQFSCEDATRTEWDFMAEAVNTAIEHGATIINIPDTVGYTNPTEYAQLFDYLQENVPEFDNVMFSTHCHNDLGMAVANSLSAIEHGCNRVEGAINGIGERAGNTALEEVATALYIRKDYYGKETNIKLSETKTTSDLVSSLSNMPVPKNKAVIGGNAFAHESGIHQDGMLKNAETYEIITPQLVGVDKTSLPLGKLSGRHAFSARLEELGIRLDKEGIDEAFDRFKVLADKKKSVTNDDLISLIRGQSKEDEVDYHLENFILSFQTDNTKWVNMTINYKDQSTKQTAEGIGSVETIYSAIDKYFESERLPLVEYSVDTVTDGIDAQAQVSTIIEDATGHQFRGTGIDYDVLTASAKAYIQSRAKAEDFFQGKDA